MNRNRFFDSNGKATFDVNDRNTLALAYIVTKLETDPDMITAYASYYVMDWIDRDSTARDTIKRELGI